MKRLLLAATTIASLAATLPAVAQVFAKPDAAAKALQGETIKLAAAAKLNNLEALKTAYGATTKACKACHDDFRQR